MLQSIHIKNFKCIGEQKFPLSNLVLLTGNNNSGKSVLIQTLLLLRQSYQYLSYVSDDIPKIMLNDYLLDLGTYRDVFNHYSDKSEGIQISIKEENRITIYETLPCDDNAIAISCNISHQYWDKSVLFKTYLSYISSARVVPANNYPTTGSKSLGKEGMYTANYIQSNKYSPITIKSLQHHNSNTDMLIDNINCWLTEMFDEDLKVVTSSVGYNVVLRYKKNGIVMLPQNMGIGLTNVLPILVTLLSAKPGDLVIIDKPELNLYDTSIAVLTKLICLAAQAGVQVICETNSNQIITSMLVLSCYFEKGSAGIDRNNVSILFMEKDHDNPGNSKVIPVPVKEGGRITYPPQNLFGQFRKDMKTLMGF